MQDERLPHNILVTGGAGFIGSAFIRYLLLKAPIFKGCCVNYDALTYAGNLENLTDIEKDSRYVFVRGNIEDQALVEETCKTYKIDTIIHLAAESHVDRSIHGPLSFLETNILGTYHLLEVVRRNRNIHFHHVSTDEVYGCLGETGIFTESTPYQPNSPYAASKASSDHLVRAYGVTYGISTCISNCSNNYGPYQFPEKLIPLMILNCLQNKPLPIYGEGKNIRDWLFVSDHAAALWLLLRKGRIGETYNIGGDSEKRNLEIVKSLIKLISKHTSTDEQELLNLITFIPDRLGHDYRYAIDCTKIKRELGWKAEYSFEKGLEETVKWYLNNPEWLSQVQTGKYRRWIETNYAQR